MKKITPERLKNIALFYLERYEASSEKLRIVLKRRLMKAKLEGPVPAGADQWIEDVVQEMQRLGYINDTRYAQNVTRRLLETGKSFSYIRSKLKFAGIKETEIQDLLMETDELTQAKLMIQKKHMGKDFSKDLARLARAGFPYEIARKALEETA